SFTSIDANISYSLGAVLRNESDTTLTIGVVNLTDQNPPFVDIAGSYDPRSGDPRGRRAYIKVGTKF
ncbi:hypothetical protein MNBD_ALPHA03-2163, partial [hydrothermal vent metagenome]